MKDGVSECRFCGYPLTVGDPICRYCFRDNSRTFAEKGGRYALAVGGILVIIAGVLAFAVTTSLALADIESYSENPVDFAIYWMLDVPAVLAIILGIQPLRCRHFGLSVAGGVCSVLGGAFFIGVFGLILILVGRKAFKD